MWLLIPTMLPSFRKNSIIDHFSFLLLLAFLLFAALTFFLLLFIEVLELARTLWWKQPRHVLGVCLFRLFQEVMARKFFYIIIFKIV